MAFEHFYEAFLDHWEKTLYKCIIIIIIIYLSRPGHGTFSDFFLILIPGGRRGEGRIEGRDGHHWNLTCPNNLACVQPPPPLGKIGERDVCVLPLIIVFRGHVIFSRICGKWYDWLILSGHYISTFSRGFHERHATSASSVVTFVCQTDGIVKWVAFRVFFVEIILSRIRMEI